MSVPIDPKSLNLDDPQAENEAVVGGTTKLLAEKYVRTPPLVALDAPEPIPDANGSLTSEQLKALATKHKPPTSWLEGGEEQLF